jgi:NAD(P)H-flavin reductase
MPLPTYTLSCIRSAVIARDVYELAFTKPEGFAFKAGQFVLLDIPLVENASDVQPRAFSIASAPAEAEILFVMKMKAGGRASRWIEEIVRPGTTVAMKGPFGMFTLKPDDAGDRLLIGTSTGVAPFRSMVIDRMQAGDARRTDLVFGVRSEEDLFWKDEFTKLSQQYDSFFLHCALSQPSDAWVGHRGRVQTLVPLIAPDMTAKRVYVCGSPEMTTEIKKLCLEQWGIAKERLHVEGYI